jgi:hypothetical protein
MISRDVFMESREALAIKITVPSKNTTATTTK